MRHAYVEKFNHPDGEPGYLIYCNICRSDGRSWSTRKITKRVLGKRHKAAMSLYSDAMDLWTLHMQLHHHDQEQPDWVISSDLDDRFADAEAQIFHVSPEEELLRKIFADTET